MPHHAQPEITCRQCGTRQPHRAHGLCGCCYLYEHRTGRPRPRHWPTTCRVCARPLGPNRRGAICVVCYNRAWRRGLRAADIYAAYPQERGA